MLILHRILDEMRKGTHLSSCVVNAKQNRRESIIANLQHLPGLKASSGLSAQKR